MSGHVIPANLLLPDQLLADLTGRIIVVASWKGGVGKSTIATELAHLFRAVLVDLDPDKGGVTRGLGYFHERYKTAPLLDALERGTVPRIAPQRRHVDLVPSHPDLIENQPTPDTMATALETWATAWGRTVVVDAPSGGWPATRGAASAAHVIGTPGVLKTAELDGLESLAEELAGYPVMVVPNMVPPSPPEAQLKRLTAITRAHRLPVTPQVKNAVWLPRRERRGPVTARPPAAQSAGYVQQVHRVALKVGEHARTAA